MAEFILPPGPWETDPHDTGEIGSVYDANGEQLLQTQPSLVHASRQSDQLAYRKELARRLTAYPDLYEVAKAVLDWIDPACTVQKDVYGDHYEDDLNERAANLYRAADAALAKAEGQS